VVDAGGAPEEGIFADGDEVVDADGAGHVHVVADDHVAGDHHVIGDGAVAAELHIMPEVAVDHEHVVIAHARDPPPFSLPT